MKHAGADTLARLGPLLQRLREETPLVERTPGAFYLRGKAFLHFHDDASGIHADARLDDAGFTRLRADTAPEQAALLARILERLAK